MKAKSIHADQLDLQGTAAGHPHTNEFSLLPGFIGFYQDAERIKCEAHQVYAMKEPEEHDAGISAREDIATQLAKTYRG
jgi:hypothetical protein